MGIALQHLSEAQRQSIAQELFKITCSEDQRGELHGLCPIHGEKNPSFSYNFKKDVYHCLACGADGDLLRLWCEVNDQGQKEGFKEFCAKFGIVLGKDQADTGRELHANVGEHADSLGPGQVMTQMLRAWDLFPLLPEDWLARVEKSRGWSREEIEILELRLQTYYLDKKGNLVHIKAPERIAIPIKDALGRLINIRLYRPGGGNMKIISWAKSTGAAALFPAQPLYNDRPVLLCEGESDTICALSHGFNAITQTSKLKTWPESHLAPFKGKDIFIAYDADKPGQKYADFAHMALQKAAKSIRMLQWPTFMGIDDSGAYPMDHGQDLTDFFVTHGKSPADLQDLLDHLAMSDPPAPAAPPPSSSVLQFFENGINGRYSFKPRLLAEKILSENKLLSDPKSGLLYRWVGKYWQEQDWDHIRKIGTNYLENEAQKSRIEDAIYLIRTLSTIPLDRSMNDRTEWLCLQNCMLNYETFEEAAHDPDFLCTNIMPVSYNPESTERCVRFEQFLATNINTPEVIAQLQEFAGYLLVQHTKFKKCLLLLGPGDDGKSKIIDILTEMLGAENCTAVAFQDLEKGFDRSLLYNKLLNTSAEIGSHLIESQFFKQITAGDSINAAYKGVDGFTFIPYCKIIFAGNSLPRFRDNSDGLFGRILPIKMKRSFPEGDPERDPNLMDKLRLELSEIFYWALCGLKRLTEKGAFTDCDETRNIMMEYRRSNNPVLCFIEEKCVVSEGDEVLKDVIYSEYRNFCTANGYKPFANGHFFEELYTAKKALVAYRKRVGNDRKQHVAGIRMKGAADPA